MANNLTDDGERLILDWLTGNSTVLPVLPVVVRLMSANGSESTPGTEIVGTDYDEQEVIFGYASTVSGVTTAKNSAIVSWPLLDSGASKTVTGYEIWDSGAIPRRFSFEVFGASVTVAANEPCQFAINALSLGLE